MAGASWLVERSAECEGGVPGSRQPASELDVIRNCVKHDINESGCVTTKVQFGADYFVLLFFLVKVTISVHSKGIKV